MKRSGPMKRTTRLQRSKPIRLRAKPRRPGKSGRRPSTVEIQAREDFKVTVCSAPCIGAGRCPTCLTVAVMPIRSCRECGGELILGELVGGIPGHVCDGDLQAMHVVPKQTLKKRGLRHLVWDALNGVPGCRRIHTRHDGKVEYIPRALLPERCIQWATEHGVLDALERHWPEATA